MVVIFHRGMRVSSRHLFLTIGDWLIIVLAQLGAVYLRLGFEIGHEYLRDNWGSLIGAVLIYGLVFYAGGMYEPPTRRRRVDFDFLPLIVTAIAAGITGLVLYARPQMTIGRGIWAISTLLILASAYGLRRLFMAMVRRGLFLKRALVLCDHPDRAADLLRLLKDNPSSLYSVAGLAICGAVPASAYVDAPPVLGNADDLVRLVEAQDVSVLLLSVSPMRSHELLSRLRPLRYAGVEIMDYVSLSEELAQEIPLAHINDEWLMTVALNSSVVQIRKVKRATDIVVAAVGLVLGAPLLLLSALLIKLTSPGPVVYRQTRVGMGGEPYVLYKLRSMRTDAEAAGAVWACKQDARVTRVGYYLRKWRIDEIPQLFNVLKGEMSLVGPRPERPEFTAKLAAFIPFYDERHLVQPGLTGWAQVRYPYAASFEAAARKLQFDLYYIKNMSFLLDVSILLRTFKTILVGLRHEDDSFLPQADKLEELLAAADAPETASQPNGGTP
ncbi:MAG TPA: exopolysaccharide biosynthesis polyprenyl glycosylphosphotransferase [Kiritimatiellia bacterium]|nr:exopolysaccharide biosynthesis polyprenyl glycosylphosphotransferase [Kiritimatiellia bacterium]HRT05742.1 exopolysaccharide biosynthesis polyprenyl glycosylphosphotransferase [Kiritimatiellia bacterium]